MKPRRVENMALKVVKTWAAHTEYHAGAYAGGDGYDDTEEK